MDEHNRKNLQSLVDSQKEQLIRYETRLKDVVSAYKSLLKEKEALEASLSAVFTKPDPCDDKNHSFDPSCTTPSSETSTSDESEEKTSHKQISTLMHSLATLSAEKSKMEASFQADKKQLRLDILAKDRMLKELEEQLKQNSLRVSQEVEMVKSKLIVERHDREKASNDHMLMIRELQKVLADERHLKDHLEMQLNDLRAEFSRTATTDRTVKELRSELDLARKKNDTTIVAPINADNSAAFLLQLQAEMTNLKDQHAIAIKNEQKRVFTAEERSKKLATVHEERVANLEARLAELSKTVCSYDRLRNQDQQRIKRLKEKIACFEDQTTTIDSDQTKQYSEFDAPDVAEMTKLTIITDNDARPERSIDLRNKFGGNNFNDIVDITENNQIRAAHDALVVEHTESKNLIVVQKSHIKTLQDKIRVLNRNIDDQELELREKLQEHSQHIQTDRIKHRENLAALESEFRSKLAELEQQLQKQRDRSLNLFEEKENEIRSLQNTLESLVPGFSSSKESHRNVGVGGSFSESCHMLHFSHELARKEVEISTLRKAKHGAESMLRQALQDKVSSQEELHDRISDLEEEIDRLERSKSREGANLEYLKNVILSFLNTNESDSKKHMLNAIGAVLKFSSSEIKIINNYFTRK